MSADDYSNDVPFMMEWLTKLELEANTFKENIRKQGIDQASVDYAILVIDNDLLKDKVKKLEILLKNNKP